MNLPLPGQLKGVFPLGAAAQAPAQGGSPERRREARQRVNRPVKVQVDEGGKYYAGQTADLSAGGTLVELQAGASLRPGQRVRLGIAWNSRDAVLSAESLVEATVVRSLEAGGVRRVAVAFAGRMAAASAA